jgi:hypothetical protein
MCPFKNDQNVNKAALPDNSHMSTEPKRKRTRSTKSTAELEAKIAELEARLANLSSQVQPSAARPAEREAPKPQARASPPRPSASGPTHGTLPAGMKPAPRPTPKHDVVESTMPEAVGEVAPAYATVSSTEYTGNRYYATRKRLSYHPPDKQFTGSAASAAAPPAPEPPKIKIRRGTLPAGFKP